MITEYSAEH